MTRYTDEKTDKVNGVTYRYSAEWIKKLETEKHWRLYWQQMALMQNKVKSGHQVLEIGVGSGFTANYLRSRGVNVTTMDIDERKKPDIVTNIVNHDWTGMQFDHILAFEVFEHIPFNEFENLLNQFHTVCKSNLFFSVPRSSRVLFSADIRMALFGSKTINLAIPSPHVSAEYHYWEIGMFHTSLKKLNQALNDHAFRIEQKKLKLSRYYFSARNKS